MKLALSPIEFASTLWAEIPPEHRTQIINIRDAIKAAPENGITAWFKTKSAELGISPGSLKAKYYALTTGGDWKILIDNRKVNQAGMAKARTSQRSFVAFLLTLVEENQRKNAPAFRRLREIWRTREKPVAGYEDWPAWPAVPEGWSDRNLADIVKREQTKAQRRAARVGTSSKTNLYLPHVITTRVGLWPGAVIQMDDMWHNNWVTVRRGNKVVFARVLELGAMDLYSGHRFHYGFKPRLRRDDGTMENLGAKDGRLFVAGLLHRHGYCPRGMSMMVEHQTMAIAEDVERLCYDYTGGLLRVSRQPIEGRHNELLGGWSASEGGNFHAKALIESAGNLIQNNLANLPMQTGSPNSGLLGPVATEAHRQWMEKTIRRIEKINPKRLERLVAGTLDFHADFVPLMIDHYDLTLARRTDHHMEGWEEENLFANEYTIVPGSGHWIPEDKIMAEDFDPQSRAIILAAARSAPQQWMQRRKLSPLEVWDRRETWTPVPPALICDILTRDLAREVTARNGFLAFRDAEIAPFPLIYEARYISGPRRGERIGHGDKVALFANPFDDRTALAVDARGRFLGELPLYKKAMTIDPAAFQAGATAAFEDRPGLMSEDLKRAAGQKARAVNEELEPVRIRHADRVQEARNLREDARALADPKTPCTEAEITFARDERRSARATAAASDLAEEALANVAPHRETRDTGDGLDF